MLKREVHTRGVVIGRRASGEGSARILIYTEELGLVRAIATSAREERSKMRPYLVTGTRGTYSLVKGKVEWRVTGVVQAHTSYYECASAAGQDAAMRVVALIEQFVQGDGADEGLFESVWEFLETVPTLSDTDVRIAEYVAVLRILAALGYVAKVGGMEEFMGPAYSAALLASAAEKRSELVQVITHGLGASGL
jgi:DNA repair protein RecO